MSTLALLFIAITLLARANDLRSKEGPRMFKVRAFGLALAGFTPFAIIAHEWGHPTNIYNTIFRVGLALVFLTTPGLPPWHKYVFGGDESK